MEDKIISAVRTFASSINSGSKVVADMSELIEVTSQLPLSSFDYWERFIRSEFSTALRESIPPKWKVWSKPADMTDEMWLKVDELIHKFDLHDGSETFAEHVDDEED